MSHVLHRSSMLLPALLLLSACGQKGPLYLEPEPVVYDDAKAKPGKPPKQQAAPGQPVPDQKP